MAIQMALRNISTVVLILFVLLLSLVFLRHNYQFYNDDSFITFRYAQNVAEGYGLRFNPDETHFGSTAMGLALVLGGLSYVADTVFHHSIFIKGQIATHGVLIPVFASIISAASVGLAVGLVFVAGRRMVGDLGAWAVTVPFGIVIVSTHYMIRVSGHETCAYLALLMLALYLVFFLSSPFKAGMVLAIAASFRPDSLLMFLIVFALIAIQTVISDDRKEGATELAKFSAAFAILYLPWLLFCKLYFGQAFPETMLAKQAQIVLGHWETYELGTVLERAIDALRLPLFSLFLLLIFAAVGISVVSAKSLRDLFALPVLPMLVALLLFGFGQSLFYHLIGVTFWIWYLTPLVFVWMVAGALSAFVVLRFLATAGWMRMSSLFVILSSLVLLKLAFPAVSWHVDKMLTTENVNQHVFSYDGVVKYLREKEPEGCSVATAEPGALGFKLGPDYKVVDELGLASPNVAKHIILGDMDYPFKTWRPDYVIVSARGKYSPHRRPWFAETYALVAEFPHDYWQARLKRGVLLYKRRDVPEVRVLNRSDGVALVPTDNP